MAYTPSALNLTSALRADSGGAQGGYPAESSASSAAHTRVCEITYLCGDGSIGDARHAVPAHPVFDAAFSAFARGTLITTSRGPVAVEDLAPGMKVATHERDPSPILWIGSMTWRRDRQMTDHGASAARLTRILTGALGLGRPLADVLTGQGARIAQRGDCRSGGARSDLMLRPIHDMIDGTHVIALSPPGDVQLYHIALRRHATITAAGLEFETYHPGSGFEHHLTYRQLALFLSLFPHVMRPAEFGSLAYPRAPLRLGGRAVT
jgi:hypothetical protein